MLMGSRNAATVLIMDDDVEGAEAALSKGSSPYHKVRY